MLLIVVVLRRDQLLHFVVDNLLWRPCASSRGRRSICTLSTAKSQQRSRVNTDFQSTATYVQTVRNAHPTGRERALSIHQSDHETFASTLRHYTLSLSAWWPCPHSLKDHTPGTHARPKPPDNKSYRRHRCPQACTTQANQPASFSCIPYQVTHSEILSHCHPIATT